MKAEQELDEWETPQPTDTQVEEYPEMVPEGSKSVLVNAQAILEDGDLVPVSTKVAKLTGIIVDPGRTHTLVDKGVAGRIWKVRNFKWWGPHIEMLNRLLESPKSMIIHIRVCVAVRKAVLKMSHVTSRNT